jgi:hypothetical protein
MDGQGSASRLAVFALLSGSPEGHPVFQLFEWLDYRKKRIGKRGDIAGALKVK